MVRNRFPSALPGRSGQQAAALERILTDLHSPNAETRAKAVRRLCPCRTAWDVPIEGYVLAMGNDPSPTVRFAAEHVLYAVRDQELENDPRGRRATPQEERGVSARRRDAVRRQRPRLKRTCA
jgi:hypothetical protein